MTGGPEGKVGGRGKERKKGRGGGGRPAVSHEKFRRSVRREDVTNCLHIAPFFFLAEIPKNEYNNKNQSTGNSPIKVELQNNMDR